MRSEALKKAQQKYYQKIKDDPDLKKLRQDKARQYYQDRKDDPIFKLKNCERAKKYYKLKKISNSNNNEVNTNT
tara:strand:- start:6374 stop:6595 length:222 start_codon:yes stop_codon:yes gene_type:complete